MMTTRMYPWEKWLRPCIRADRLLKKGRDFRCTTHVMAQQIRNRANQHDLLVSLTVGRVYVTVTSVRRKP